MRVRDFLKEFEQQLEQKFGGKDEKITAFISALLKRRWVIRALKGKLIINNIIKY